MTTTIEKNRQRDLYLKNPEGGVIFIPQGWCDEFDQYVNDEPEIMTYCPTGLGENGPVDNLWVPVRSLNKMKEITENEARRIHPKLFETLARINVGVDKPKTKAAKHRVRQNKRKELKRLRESE